MTTTLQVIPGLQCQQCYRVMSRAEFVNNVRRACTSCGLVIENSEDVLVLLDMVFKEDVKEEMCR